MAGEINVEERIDDINKRLEYANIPTKSLFDASKSLGALIFVCHEFARIIEAQQRRIEHLEDVLRNHLEAR